MSPPPPRPSKPAALAGGVECGCYQALGRNASPPVDPQRHTPTHTHSLTHPLTRVPWTPFSASDVLCPLPSLFLPETAHSQTAALGSPLHPHPDWGPPWPSALTPQGLCSVGPFPPARPDAPWRDCGRGPQVACGLILGLGRAWAQGRSGWEPPHGPGQVGHRPLTPTAL